MKAVVASLVTALVIVSAAWAGNVTPQQVSKLSGRVTTLESRLTAETRTTSCILRQWNAQRYEPYFLDTSDGFATKSGTLTIFSSPSAPDGLTGTGYLIVSPSIGTTC